MLLFDTEVSLSRFEQATFEPERATRSGLRQASNFAFVRTTASCLAITFAMGCGDWSAANVRRRTGSASRKATPLRRLEPATARSSDRSDCVGGLDWVGAGDVGECVGCGRIRPHTGHFVLVVHDREAFCHEVLRELFAAL